MLMQEAIAQPVWSLCSQSTCHVSPPAPPVPPRRNRLQNEFERRHIRNDSLQCNCNLETITLGSCYGISRRAKSAFWEKRKRAEEPAASRSRPLLREKEKKKKKKRERLPRAGLWVDNRIESESSKASVHFTIYLYRHIFAEQ